MNLRRARRSLGLSVVALAAALILLGTTSALAAGPQPLPEPSCNAGTSNASEQVVDNVRARDAVPHIEHPWLPFAIPYCHHFNPAP